MGFMSAELYRFYTGPINNLSTQNIGALCPLTPFKLKETNLSTLLYATANSTGLNLKITDIMEGSIYDTAYHEPKLVRTEVLSTVPIAQTPGNSADTGASPAKRKLLTDGKKELE